MTVAAPCELIPHRSSLCTSRMTRADLQEIAALSRRSERARQGRFLIEGVRSVEAAVAAGAPLDLVLATAEAADDARVAALLAGAGDRVSIVPARDMDRISDARTSQGVAAVSRSIVEDGGGVADDAASTSVLVLDGVQDPGNVGTIVRTAAWFAIDVLIAGPGTADFESPKVVRAAMGGLWDVRLRRTLDMGPTLDALVAAGFTLVGSGTAGESLQDWSPRGRVALLLGSEAHGLSDSAGSRVATTIAIKRAGVGAGAESLNVAVAAGILLHQWRAGATEPP